MKISDQATKIFKGKIIARIRYTTPAETEDEWVSTPFIEFTDGSWIIASADDEGNHGGAFWTSHPVLDVIPQGGT
jgi:hypothetical protein